VRSYFAMAGRAVRSVLGAFTASVVWLGFTLLIIAFREATSFQVAVFAPYLISNYSLIFIGMLIALDIWIDVRLAGSVHNLFNRYTFLWRILIVLIGLVTALTMYADTAPEHAELCAAIGLTILFLIRLASYLKPGRWKPIGVSTSSSIGQDGP